MEASLSINSKIAKWLGFKNIRNIKFPDLGLCIVDGIVPIQLDFLHDRNQQKWIEDELQKRGIGTMYDYDPTEKRHSFTLYDGQICNPISESDHKSKNEAFISAVEQLIDKELTTK